MSDQKSSGGRFPRRTPRPWRGRVAGGLVGNLMLRSFERSERIYNAMLARSYTGELLTFGRPAVASEDVYLLAAWFSFLILALVIAFMF